MKLAFTVDLENDLGFLESRFGIDEGIPVLLSLLEKHDVRGTFFVSGESLDALRENGMLGELCRQGHEIASHGFRHTDYRSWEYGKIMEEVRRSKEALEQIVGCEVTGYRAPQFLINASYLATLKECGFRYDSSFPDPDGISAAKMLRKMRVDREILSAAEGLTEFGIDSVPWFRVPHGLLWINTITFALYRRVFPGLEKDLITFYLHPFDLIRNKGRIPLDLKRKVFYLRNGNAVAGLLDDLLGFWKYRGVEFVRLVDQLSSAEVSL
jgi:peptidoglycan/xylan/chitin deacetylase (PgdA/CDA1 family)